MCALAPHFPIIINEPLRQCRLIWNIRVLSYLYSSINLGVQFVHTKSDFSAFTFNPDSNIFCKTFSIASRWSTKSCLVITITPSIYACTVLNPSNSLDIFSWKILRFFLNPLCSCWFSYILLTQ